MGDTTLNIQRLKNNSQREKKDVKFHFALYPSHHRDFPDNSLRTYCIVLL